MADLVIVGAGTAGLSAAIYARRAGLETVVFEGETYGGQIINTPEIVNYPGIASISGFDFATSLYNQAVGLGSDIRFETVIKIEGDSINGFTVTSEYSSEKCKAVIIATGAKNRRLDIANEQELIGRGVSFCATCDGAFYKDKTVAVLGGGNTALDDSLYLSNLCQKVYLIHRRNEFRGENTTLELVKSNEKIEILTPCTVEQIFGDTKLTSIEVLDSDKRQKYELAIDGLFIAIGQEPANKPFEGLVAMEEGYIISDENMRTNIPGIFVAGDGRKKKVRQLTTAASDGATAAIEAYEFIKMGGVK